MKKLSFILFAVCLILGACSNDDSDTKDNESKNLEKMYTEIIDLSLAKSQPCTNSAEWAFTAIGSKSCGGVAGYLIYSKKINTVDFLAKVKAYTDAQVAFNTKWGINSTCEIIQPPYGVDCVDGKPKLNYNPILY